MPTCPDGHDSSAADYCDICGMRMDGPALSTPGPSTALTADPCPQCGAAQTGKFCESCGFNFASGLAEPGPPHAEATRPAAPAAPPTPAAPAAWTAVVTADRSYFDRVIAASGPDAASIQFPAYCPERRFTLAGSQMRIGRRSASRGLEPEIDLTGPPTDPGISHLHAVLIAQPDGTWAVLDPGSSNGTEVNDVSVAENVAVPLKDGDRIGLGAWTVLTIAGDSARD